MTKWLIPALLLLSAAYSCTPGGRRDIRATVLENNPESDTDFAVLYLNDRYDFSVSYWGSTNYWISPSPKTQKKSLPAPYRKALKKFPGQQCLMLYKLKSEKPPRTFSIYGSALQSPDESSKQLLAHLATTRASADTLNVDTLLTFNHKRILYNFESAGLITDVMEYHLSLDSASFRFVFTQESPKAGDRSRQLRFLERDAQSIMNTFKTGINARRFKEYAMSPSFMASNAFIDSKYNYLEPLHWIETYAQNDTLAKRAASIKSAKKTFYAFVGKMEQEASDAIFPLNDGKYEAANALKEIATAVAGRQVVMLNENHLNPYCRIFARDLLPELYQQGFRYLAVETLTFDSLLNERKYPLKSSGFYVSEPSFGDLLRRALQLGYQLVPYENDQPCNCKDMNCRVNCRDSAQAQNLSRILERDPRAKILVYAGHGHIYKKNPNPAIRYMAERFAEITGITPFCIDQSELTAAPGTSLCAAANGPALLRSSSVLKDSSGAYWTLPKRKGAVDMQIIHPTAQLSNHWADWLLAKGDHALNLSFNGIKFENTLFQVFYRDELTQNGEKAIPLINLLLSKQNRLTATLPDGAFYCRVVNRNRVKLFEKEFVFTASTTRQ